jgi:hypothetical protein
VGRSLQDSDSKGRRYVNAKARTQAQAKRRRDEFLQELDQIRAGSSQAFPESGIPDPEFPVDDGEHSTRTRGPRAQERERESS